jgi:hypothetical protein
MIFGFEERISKLSIKGSISSLGIDEGIIARL